MKERKGDGGQETSGPTVRIVTTQRPLRPPICLLTSPQDGLGDGQREHSGGQRSSAAGLGPTVRPGPAQHRISTTDLAPQPLGIFCQARPVKEMAADPGHREGRENGTGEGRAPQPHTWMQTRAL